MAVQVQTKAVVSVAEMARMVGLSRSRFYQLVEVGVFPPPVYDVSTRRPLYEESQQKICLEVRRRNSGVNGKPVLFYARGPAAPAAPKKRSKPTKTPAKDERIVALLDGLHDLGLTNTTAAVVEQAVRELFPSGAAGLDPGEVLRSVFLHLKRSAG